MVVGALALTACDSETGPKPPAEGGCDVSSDCAITEYCDAGVCVEAGECAKWAPCADKVDNADPGSGKAYACISGQCTRQCIADSDCTAEGEICTDFGSCVTYEGELLPFDSGNGAPSALRAGVGEAILNYPVGISLGGYGSRAKGNDGRYAVSLSATQGIMDGQFARAVVLENATTRLMLIRVPIIFSFDQMHERVARALQERTGKDWRDELILAATHTHSGPARFWRLPTDGLMDVGMLGAGTFSQQVEDWLVGSITDAAFDALDNMQDAKFAWQIVEAFDVEDVVGRDRWRSTPPFDMNRLLLMRLDDLDDVPMAVLFSYAAHATDNSDDYATDDVAGGAEHGLSVALTQHFGRHVPTLYFPENGGSMSHASGAQGHAFPHSRERAGAVLVDKALPTLLAMTPKREVGFKSRNYRFNINYDAIGYEPMEFGKNGRRPLSGEYTNGGLMCNGPNANDADYATYIPMEKLGCLPLTAILNNRQPTPLTRTQVMALELDGLSIVTLPGEATQEVGWQALARMRDVFERETASSWVLSYVNDHLLYITPTNLRGEKPDVPGYLGPAPDSFPNYAFSYLQGGYETDMSPWGPKFGDFLMNRVEDAFAWLQDDSKSPAYPAILPAQFTRVEETPFAIDSADAASIGVVTEQVPATLERLVPVTFTWMGGDPGAEAPQVPLVTLQKHDGAAFVDVQAPTMLPYTNRGPYFATRVKILDPTGSPSYAWSVYWEAPKDMPLGTYRFQVDGHYLDAATNARTPYTVTSDAFELLPTTFDIAAERVGETIVARPTYAASTHFEMSAGGERGKLAGSLRMRHWMVPTGVPDPVLFDNEQLLQQAFTAHWHISDTNALPRPADDAAITTMSVGDRQGVPTSKVTFEAPPGVFISVRLEGADAYGNTGTVTLPLN